MKFLSRLSFRFSVVLTMQLVLAYITLYGIMIYVFGPLEYIWYCHYARIIQNATCSIPYGRIGFVVAVTCILEVLCIRAILFFGRNWHRYLKPAPQ